MSIITYPLNGVTYGASDAETYLCTRKSGVYSAEDNFSVSITGARQITVSAGLAWINDGRFRGKSVVSTEPVTLDVPAASGTLPRKDLVVLRFDSDANASVLAIKSGAESASPAVPTVTRDGGVYELGLYAIDIPAGSISVATADVTSLLLDEEYCGLMRDGVTGIPTAQLHAQAKELIDSFNALLHAEFSSLLGASVEKTAGLGDPSCEIILDEETGKIRFVFRNIRAEPPLAFTVTLSVSAWSDNAQTITDPRFAASGYAYTVTPRSSGYMRYAKSLVYADDVTTDGQITFRCGKVPEGDITVNILRTEAEE